MVLITRSGFFSGNREESGEAVGVKWRTGGPLSGKRYTSAYSKLLQKPG